MRSNYSHVRGVAEPGALCVCYPVHGATYKLEINGLVLSVADANGVFSEFDRNVVDNYSQFGGFNGGALMLDRWDFVTIESEGPVPSLSLSGDIVEARNVINN